MYVFVGRRPVTNADAHRRFTLPDRRPTPARTALLYPLDDAARYCIIAERNQYLVEYNIVKDLKTGVFSGQPQMLAHVGTDHLQDSRRRSCRVYESPPRHRRHDRVAIVPVCSRMDF